MHKRSFSSTLFLCFALVIATTLVINAGPLDPPAGPILSTGRFGPRVDVLTLAGDADSVHQITEPGSYYLSGNILGASGFNGIEIFASNVTLDLNGFAVIGDVGSLNGIRGQGTSIVVKNGNVSDWGNIGVWVSGGSSRVENIQARNNGSWGFNVAGNFSHNVIACNAQGNGAMNPNSGGFTLGCDTTMRDCLSMCNTGDGVRGTFRCAIYQNNISFNTGMGINLTGGDSLIRANNVVANTNGNNPMGSTLINNRGI